MNKYTLKIITGSTYYLQIIYADYFEINQGAYIFYKSRTNENNSTVLGASPVDLTVISEIERNDTNQ